MEKINDRYKEKKAVWLNIASFLFCFLILSINYFPIITLFIAVLAVIELIHIIFGDITQSYKLLRKKAFLCLYKISLIIVSFLCIFLLFLVNMAGKIYFISLALAFLFDWLANKIRSKKKTNKISGFVGLLKK